MIVFIGCMIAMFFVVLIGTTMAVNNFSKNVDYLFGQSPKINGEEVLYKESLPIPVTRYFLYSFKENQTFISYVRLKHHGKFRTSLKGDWKDITGVEYFTVDRPGFIWKGRLGILSAVDRYVSGQGSLTVYLFSFLRIMKGSGSKFNQGELLRWLGEAVWFPTALLPSGNLQWEAIDDFHAKLLFMYEQESVYYWVTFNEEGQITTLETKRYLNGKSLHTWIGKLSNYEMLNGMMVPTTMEAVWKVRGHEHPYAIFQLSQIEYDRPEKFDS